MSNLDWVLPAASALLVCVGWGFLRWRAFRALRAAEPGGDCNAALEALGRDFGGVIGGGGLFLCVLVFAHLKYSSPATTAGAWLLVLLVFWWLYRGFAGDQLRLLEVYRGPEWNAPIHSALAALTLGPLLGVPLCAALLAWLWLLGVDRAGATEPFMAFAVYPGLLVWGVWAESVVRRSFRDPVPLPGAVAERLAALLGPEAAQSMVVLPTRDVAFYNAIALPGRRGAKVWMAECLLGELEDEEAVAVLLHEHSHVARRDDLRRLGWTFAMHLSALISLWAIGMSPGLALSSALFAGAFLVASTVMGQKHELIADAEAARYGLAEAMASALETLHRLNATPSSSDNEAWMTHPLLDARRAALGVGAREDEGMGEVAS